MGVIVGVSVMEGVSVMVGVNVMVGDNVMVGIVVIVGVRVMVGEGGKYRYATGSPKRPNQIEKIRSSMPTANIRQPLDMRCLRKR